MRKLFHQHHAYFQHGRNSFHCQTLVAFLQKELHHHELQIYVQMVMLLLWKVKIRLKMVGNAFCCCCWKGLYHPNKILKKINEMMISTFIITCLNGFFFKEEVEVFFYYYSTTVRNSKWELKCHKLVIITGTRF